MKCKNCLESLDNWDTISIVRGLGYCCMACMHSDLLERYESIKNLYVSIHHIQGIHRKNGPFYESAAINSHEIITVYNIISDNASCYYKDSDYIISLNQLMAGFRKITDILR